MENKYYIKSVYIPNKYQAIFDKLNEYCEMERLSKSYVICEAVKEYLERKKEKK